MSEKVELHLTISGRVQGVGFRWTVQDHAENHRLVGTVANLANGKVEVFAQGSKQELETFIQAIEKEPGSAQIQKLNKTYHPITKEFFSFQIVF